MKLSEYFNEVSQAGAAGITGDIDAGATGDGTFVSGNPSWTDNLIGPYFPSEDDLIMLLKLQLDDQFFKIDFSNKTTPDLETIFKSVDWDYEYDEPGENSLKSIIYDDPIEEFTEKEIETLKNENTTKWKFVDIYNKR